MKIYIIFAIILFSVSSCKSQKNMDSYIEIDFQDFFKDDTVSLEIENQLIFRSIVIESDFSTGLTELSLKVFLHENGGVVKYNNKIIKVNKLKNPVGISVYLNGACNKYVIDLEQGKHIGLSKKSKRSFDFYQSKEPFEYD